MVVGGRGFDDSCCYGRAGILLARPFVFVVAKQSKIDQRNPEN